MQRRRGEEDVRTRRRIGELARKSGGDSTSGNLWASATSGSTGAAGLELVAMAAVAVCRMLLLVALNGRRRSGSGARAWLLVGDEEQRSWVP